MKNILLRLVVLSLLIVSCTTDSIDTFDSIDSKINDKKSIKTVRLTRETSPENPANSYDVAGKIHNDILDIYLGGNYQYNTITQISQQIETIAANNSDFILLNPGVNLLSNLDVIQEIIDNPQTKLNQAIGNSIMTNLAKESLSNFMGDVLLRKNDPYTGIYQFIVSYESFAMNNPEFNNEDKRIILTTSSIVRYSLYYASGRKDEDWGSGVGHRVGALTGAIDNSTTAIVRALVTGIMINNLVTE
ncbi:hypothetical protein [Flavobacterium tructae]|uniref:hypothetical protein n=1 Tax=Flavobacterium tructae TaxID=1114873 RepID=UPI0035A9697C